MPLTFISRGTDDDGAALADMIVTQGDDLWCQITVTDDDTVLDLTGYSADLIVQNASGSTILAFDSTAVPPTITISPASGLLTFTRTSSTTADLPPGRYWYAMRFTDASGNVSTEARGACVIVRGPA